MNIELLISKVFVRRSLWDRKDRQHHNRYVLDKKWDEIAVEMKTSRDAVRARWKALRDTYRKELKKISEKWSGDDDSQYSPTWPHFGKLSFLKDQFTLRHSSGDLSASQITPSDMDNENDISSLEKSGGQCDESVMESLLVDIKCEPGITSQPPKIMKRRRESNDSVGTTLNSSEENNITIPGIQTMEPDEDRSFLESLLPHLRLVPARDKLLLRIKMQELVYSFVCDVYSAE